MKQDNFDWDEEGDIYCFQQFSYAVNTLLLKQVKEGCS